MEIDGKHYPEESWDLDWDNSNYCLAYSAYQYFKRICNKTDSIPYADKTILILKLLWGHEHTPNSSPTQVILGPFQAQLNTQVH